MKLLFPSLFLLVCLISCNSGNGVKNEAYLFETDDTLTFQLDSNVSVYNHSVLLSEDDSGNEFISFVDGNNWSIYLYALGADTVMKRIQYETEGPNGVGQVFSCLYRHPDEFLLPDYQRPYISVLNSSGEKTGSLDLTDKGILSIHNELYNPLVFIGDKIYSVQNPRRSPSGAGLMESPTEIAINTRDLTVETSPCLLPSKTLDLLSHSNTADGKFIEESRCYDGKNFVYSFFGNEELIIMSPDFKKIETKLARSRYIPDGVSLDVIEDSDFSAVMRRACTGAEYGRIIYDKYRRCYYRFAYPETDLDEKEPDWHDLTQSGRDEFSIIILDEDLNVIGETMFPRDRFRSNLYFVCKDGFYISCNHYKNPGYTDDAFQFVKFEVKKN
ncbi:MAG: DUF4221 domain-containing protein [Bacteroidaceae bacterium]|nr:DUF4221 domain-containing protein [Bacteroidaceae bacterium]